MQAAFLKYDYSLPAALNGSGRLVQELLGIELNWSLASPQSVGGPDWN